MGPNAAGVIDFAVAAGVMINLVASSQDAECGYLVDTDPTRFNTDYSGYANRMWQVGTGNFTDNAYGTCVAPTTEEDDSSGGDSGGDDSDTTLKAGDYYIDFSDSLEQLEVEFTQFGGTFTQFTQDPTDANKTVASTTKNATAEEWAGTTIDAGTVIFPLTETATTMTVRVYSPAADMVVRLKLEESADATHTVETDALTTVANQWETLTFDFSNEATNDGDPTNPLNINYVFDKLSIFFNKGVTGADAGEVIFYWDSLIWVGEDELQPTSLALTVTAADAKAVRLTGPFWQWDPNGGPEAADNGDGTWTVTFAEAPSEAMEYLWVADGVQENLVASSQDAECGYLVDTDPTRFNTDYSGYANRMWQVGTGNFTDNAYGTCVAPTGDDTSGEDAYGTDPAAGITVAESSVFYDKANATWVKVIDLALVADGVSSQGAQTLSMNVTELPEGGANYRVYKTTASGGDFLGNAKALALGANDITIAGVAFDRAVKIQLSSADVRFDSLVVNGTTIYPEPVE